LRRSNERPSPEEVIALSARPSEAVLTARVARMYYVDDRSKSDIADELGISRFRVARLIEAARRTGVVRIEIHSNGIVNTELSQQLQDRWGLAHALVIDDDEYPQLRQRLGQCAAALLQEIVTGDDVLGMPWSRSLGSFGEALSRLPPIPVVQLTGALSRPDGKDILGLVRHVAAVGGGTPYVFYAPMVMPDVATARAVRKQPDLVRARGLVEEVTIALVSIGGWAPGLSTIYEAVDSAARDAGTRDGICAEVAGIFLDAAGSPVTSALSQRIVGIDAGELSRVRTVLGMVYDDAKAAATIAALRSNMITALVTHASLAHKLLETADVDMAG
jgi:DNA-binding transcriptional regulator LsrR (DeoR family)